MLAAFHDPDQIHAGRLGLPLIRVAYLKSHAVGQAAGFSLGRRHARLNRADSNAGYFAIEFVREPQRRSTNTAPDIEHASASGDTSAFGETLHQLDLRARYGFIVLPITMMKMFAPEKTIKKRQPIIMPANMIDFYRKLLRRGQYHAGRRK